LQYDSILENILSPLNIQQHKAVKTTEGYLRIVAGAGSVKTKALTHRCAYLVKAAGILPQNILCVTFTSKAAGEMRRRVLALIGEGYDTSLITTYHGFCVLRVLRADIEKLFYPRNFIILDTTDQKKIMEGIYDELELKLDHSSFQKILTQIEIRKEDLSYIESLVDPGNKLDHSSTNIMRHHDYSGTIRAGCICTGRMEGNSEKASQREHEFKNLQNRRMNFIKREWKKAKKAIYI
jgi:DNA helicase-2/ATP-dependent DNA helicase PcrA